MTALQLRAIARLLLWFAPCPEQKSIGFTCAVKHATPHCPLTLQQDRLMPSTDTTRKNMPYPRIHQHRISLVAGAILIAVTLLVGISVFMVMQRHAEELLSKNLQSSLQNRGQLIQTEIGAGFDKAML